jgi:molybdopterin synthase catalytic subunit
MSLERAPTLCELTHDAIDEKKYIEHCRAGAAGAISVFIGTTRDTFLGEEVSCLEYEAYAPMALKEMRAIADEITAAYGGDGDERATSDGRGGHGVRAIAMVHRLGRVDARETSVCIVVSASHRRDATDATSYAIEELKKRVPIWKKEQFAARERDGVWKANNLGAFAPKP